jgi:hypothetical protein
MYKEGSLRMLFCSMHSCNCGKADAVRHMQVRCVWEDWRPGGGGDTADVRQLVM